VGESSHGIFLVEHPNLDFTSVFDYH
jgi:hypothetical protein